VQAPRAREASVAPKEPNQQKIPLSGDFLNLISKNR